MIIKTVDQILEYAERNRTADCPCPSCAELGAIVDLLSHPYPGGQPKPEIDDTGCGLTFKCSWDGEFDPNELRGIAATLLRVADIAESHR